MKNINYYKLLGLNENFTPQELKKAYFKKAKQYHPDVNKSKNAEAIFKHVNEAYETLKNPDSRREYDYAIKNSKNEFSTSSRNNPYTYRSTPNTNHNAILQLFILANLSQNDIDAFINSNYYTEATIIRAFETFWITFWSGGTNTWSGLNNKNVSKAFLSFASNKHINSIVESTLREINSNIELKKEYQNFKKTLNQTYEFFEKNKSNHQECFKRMKHLIIQRNGFDLQQYFLWFLITKKQSYGLLKSFEYIYENKPEGVNLNRPNNSLAKKSFSYGTIALLIIVIISYWFFRS